MITIPAKAFAPFFNKQIKIRAHVYRNEFAETITVPAIVMPTDPYSLANGIGTSATNPGYVVMIRKSDLAISRVPVGSVIEADEDTPRLFVQSSYSNGDLIHLDCSANERG